jgi:hypothetical protein
LKNWEDHSNPAATQFRQRCLTHQVDPGTVEPHLTLGGSIQTSHHVDQGGLATPARAHDRNELTALDHEVDTARQAPARL